MVRAEETHGRTLPGLKGQYGAQHDCLEPRDLRNGQHIRTEDAPRDGAAALPVVLGGGEDGEHPRALAQSDALGVGLVRTHLRRRGITDTRQRQSVFCQTSSCVLPPAVMVVGFDSVRGCCGGTYHVGEAVVAQEVVHGLPHHHDPPPRHTEWLVSGTGHLGRPPTPPTSTATTHSPCPPSLLPPTLFPKHTAPPPLRLSPKPKSSSSPSSASSEAGSDHRQSDAT